MIILRLIFYRLKSDFVLLLFSLAGISLGIFVIIGGNAYLLKQSQGIQQRMDGLEGNALVVYPVPTMTPEGMRTIPFDRNDLVRLREALKSDRPVAGVASKRVPIKVDGQNANAILMGVEFAYFSIRSWSFTSNAKPSTLFERHDQLHCALGSGLTKGRSPSRFAEMKLTVNGKPCRFFGVLEARGGSVDGRDFDNIVYVSLENFSRYISPGERVDMIYVRLAPSETARKVSEQVRAELKSIRGLPNFAADDFRILNASAIRSFKKDTNAKLGLLETLFSFTCLVLGGVGSSSILYLKVKIRRSEIALVRILGASERQIVAEIVVEGVLLSLLAYLIGVAGSLAYAFHVGALAMFGAAGLLPLLFYCLISSLLIGMLAGIFPSIYSLRIQPAMVLKN